MPALFLVAGEDRNIPAQLQRFMAERADARRAVEIAASHAAAVSNPETTTDLILKASAVPAAV